MNVCFKPTLSAYLTPAEWQLCFALSFAHQAFLEVGPFESLADELRYAVAHLAECGFGFQAVQWTSDGRIVPLRRVPLFGSEQNLATCTLLARGEVPDYEAIFKAAISVLAERPHFSADLELLREALSLIQEQAGGEVAPTFHEVHA